MSDPTNSPEGLSRAACERLSKWRVVFTGWQLGTRAKGDPESDAVSNHRELSTLMHAELNALVGLLVAKGVFTADEFRTQLSEEADHLSNQYARQFPGFKATDFGMQIDPSIAADTTRFWPK